MVFKNWTDQLAGSSLHKQLFWRTTVPLILAGIVLLGLGIYSASRVHRLHERGNSMLTENVSSIREAKELETLFYRFRYRLKRYLRSDNERHLEEIAAIIPECRDRLASTRTFGNSDGEQQVVETLIFAGEELFKQFEQLIFTLGDDRMEIAARMADELIPGKLLGTLNQYIELNEQTLTESNSRNRSTANLLMFGLISLGTCGGVAGLLAGYGIARSVSRTIVQLSIPIRDTAAALLTVGKTDSLSEGVAIAAEAIDSGKAKAKLQELVDVGWEIGD